MTTPRLPTPPYRVLAEHIGPHGKRRTCVAVHPDQLTILQDAAREADAYRLQWEDATRPTIRQHEVKERGVVKRWTVNHAPKSRDERLAEIAAADAFEPMEEWSEAA